MEALLRQIAEQGFGYVLFVASLLVCYFLYKENRQLSQEKVDLANKRVEDLKEAQKNYSVLSEALQVTTQNTLTIVTNLQNVLNKSK
jgi:hypothetical protein